MQGRPLPDRYWSRDMQCNKPLHLKLSEASPFARGWEKIEAFIEAFIKALIAVLIEF